MARLRGQEGEGEESAYAELLPQLVTDEEHKHYEVNDPSNLLPPRYFSFN